METFSSHGNCFDIPLVIVFFLQIYRGICLSHFLSFCFFLLQISFCIYFLPALLLFLYCFHNNILLYLVLHLCFFDNKSTHSFFIYSKNYKTPFLSIKLELFIMITASYLLKCQK